MKCIDKNCMKRASFNILCETNALYCSNHKKENMINIKSKRCTEDCCMKMPTFNLPSKSSALYCLEHKKDNMINIKHK